MPTYTYLCIEIYARTTLCYSSTQFSSDSSFLSPLLPSFADHNNEVRPGNISEALI